MKEEQAKVLKMLEEGKIGAVDAEKLLDAIEKSEGAGENVKAGRVLKIRVFERGSQRAKVNLNIPLSWSKLIMPFVESKVQGQLRERGIDIDVSKIKENVENAHVGKIIDIEDGGDKVEIYIE